MRTQLIAELADLEAIRGEWNELALPCPMQSPDWLISWWQVYGNENRELAVLAIRGDDGRLLGLCPWYVEARPRSNCLRWLGDGAVCSDHASILAAPGVADLVVEVVGHWLRNEGGNHCGQMFLEAADADDAVLARQLAGLRERGWLVTTRAQSGSSCIELPASWEQYLATVSKNHRKRCRKWQREFFETGRARVDVATEPEDCLQSFGHLVRLHNQRRQAAGKRGAFEDDDFRQFHRLAIRRLAESGKIQLRLVWIDEEPAAVEYVLVDNAALYAYQSGMSTAGEAVSAGNLSVLSLIRDAIELRRRRVDLLRGTEAYKFSWGAVHREAATVLLRRRSVTGLVQSCLDNAVQRARQLRTTITHREVLQHRRSHRDDVGATSTKQ